MYRLRMNRGVQVWQLERDMERVQERTNHVTECFRTDKAGALAIAVGKR